MLGGGGGVGEGRILSIFYLGRGGAVPYTQRIPCSSGGVATVEVRLGRESGTDKHLITLAADDLSLEARCAEPYHYQSMPPIT